MTLQLLYPQQIFFFLLRKAKFGPHSSSILGRHSSNVSLLRCSLHLGLLMQQLSIPLKLRLGICSHPGIPAIPNPPKPPVPPSPSNLLACCACAPLLVAPVVPLEPCTRALSVAASPSTWWKTEMWRFFMYWPFRTLPSSRCSWQTVANTSSNCSLLVVITFPGSGALASNNHSLGTSWGTGFSSASPLGNIVCIWACTLSIALFGLLSPFLLPLLLRHDRGSLRFEAYRFMTQILLPPLFIQQFGVSLSDFLERLLRPILLTLVGVQQQGHLSVGLLDLIICCTLFDA